MDVDVGAHLSATIHKLFHLIDEATSKAKNGHLDNYEAVQLCEQAIKAAQSELGDNDPHIVDAWEERANLLARDLDLKESAQEAYEHCLELRTKFNGEHDIKTARTKLRVAHLRHTGDLSLDGRTRDLVQSVAKTHIYLFETEADLTLATHVGDGLRDKGEFDEAETLFGCLLDWLEGPSHNASFRTIATRLKLAQTLLEHERDNARKKQSPSRDMVDRARKLVEQNLRLLNNADAKTRIMRKRNEELLQDYSLLSKPPNPTPIPAAENDSSLHRDMSSTTLLSVHHQYEQRGRASSTSHVKSETDTLCVLSQGDIPKTHSTPSIHTLASKAQQKSPTEALHIPEDRSLPTTKDHPFILTGVGGAGEEVQESLGIFRVSTGRIIQDTPIPNRSPQEDTMTVSTKSGLEMEMPIRGRDTLVAAQRKSQDGNLASDYGTAVPKATTNLGNKARDWGRSMFRLTSGFGVVNRPDTPPARDGSPEAPGAPPGYDNMSRTSSASTFDESVGKSRNAYLDSTESEVVKQSQNEENSSAKHADDWFFEADKLPSTHKLLYEKNPYPREDGRPVRVCIIDTGLDGCHPFLMDQPWGKGWGARIKKCHDFSSGLKPTDVCSWDAFYEEACEKPRNGVKALQGMAGFVDEDGHGTHCAGIILQTAPKADLYIAKVGIGRNNPPRNSVIADAIEHAAKSWQVDIISMSIGLARESDQIRKAIQDHCSNVIFIAAAGNHGGNEPKTLFPASMYNVISMRATNGEGGGCSFNSWSKNEGGDKFYTLGSDVLSMWTTQMQSESGPFVLEKRASGTSAATPVAAGIAALVLDFVRQRDRQTDQQDQPEYLAEAGKLIYQSPSERMRAIFRAMSTQEWDNGPRYLCPWHLLQWDKSEEGGDWQGNAAKLYKTLDKRKLYPPNQKRRASAPEAGKLVKKAS